MILMSFSPSRQIMKDLDKLVLNFSNYIVSHFVTAEPKCL